MDVRLFVPIIFFIALSGGFIFTIKAILKGKQTQLWLQTVGIINSSEVERVHGELSYSHQIKYNYSVNSKNFVGKKMSVFESVSSNYKAVELLSKKYKVGEKITVYYNPNNTEEAFLEPGVPLGQAIFRIICMTLLLISSLAICWKTF